MKKSISVIILTLLIFSCLSVMFPFNESANLSNKFDSKIKVSQKSSSNYEYSINDQFQGSKNKNIKGMFITSEQNSNINAADLENETEEDEKNIDDFFKENWFIIFIVGTLVIVIPGAYFTIKALKEND